jgi:hypothetical protein
VKLANSQLVHAGEELGVVETAYKSGDSKDFREGAKGIVYDVVTGPFAKKAGFDVMVLIDVREPDLSHWAKL